jgi:predicted metalloprotease with PDZ domain
MFTSYYSYGGALALALDLQLRSRFGKSLDGFMQQMWKAFGKTEKPYTMPAMQQVLASYTNAAFATSFFQKHVYGHDPVDYNQLLQPAGMSLKKAGKGKAWICNVRYNAANNILTVTSNTIRNTPLYNAGVDVDDVLMEMDGAKLQKAEDVETVLAAHHPGDVIKIKYKHQDQVIERDLKLEESPFLTIDPGEAKGKQAEFRKMWMEAPPALQP